MASRRCRLLTRLQLPDLVGAGTSSTGPRDDLVDPTDQYIVFDTSDIGFIAFPVTPSHYSMTRRRSSWASTRSLFEAQLPAAF